MTGCLASACASFDESALPEWREPARYQSRTTEQVTVSAAILSDDEARLVYGADLAEAGLRAVWLRIENRSPHAWLFLTAALDPN